MIEYGQTVVYINHYLSIQLYFPTNSAHFILYKPYCISINSRKISFFL